MDEFILKLMAGNKVNGLRQARRAIFKNQIKAVVMAEDTDRDKKEQLLELCKLKDVPVYVSYSKAELGQKLGLDVACAIVGILK